MIDQPCPVTGLAADEALDLARGQTARLVTGAVQAAAIRRRIRIDASALHLTGTNAAYLATTARRGGHDLLSRGLELAAGPHRHAGPLAGPAHLGTGGR